MTFTDDFTVFIKNSRASTEKLAVFIKQNKAVLMAVRSKYKNQSLS